LIHCADFKERASTYKLCCIVHKPNQRDSLYFVFAWKNDYLFGLPFYLKLSAVKKIKPP